MSNLALRIIFGALYVAIMVVSAILGWPYFGLLMALFTFLSINEIATLSNSLDTIRKWLIPALVFGAIAFRLFYLPLQVTQFHIIIAFAAQVVCLFLVYRQLRNRSTVNFGLASVYLTIPLIFLSVAFNSDTYMILFYLITIWLYDSMAYVVGKQIGKTPIFPRVSPKKTVEGTVGGIIITMVLMSLIGHYLDSSFTMIRVLIVVPVIILFAILGDFVESYMKRKLGVKDSGTILPGHGGVLDRLDSIYLSALPYLIILLLV